MSLILDALKKSEQERRRERGPDLQSIHRPVLGVSTPARRTGWLLLVAVLVVVNVAAVAWWLLRERGEGGVEVAALPTTAEAPVATNALSAEPSGERVAPPNGVAVPPDSGAGASPSSASAPRATPQPSFTQPSLAPTTITGEPEFTSVAPGSALQSSAPVQELWELPESVRRNLPPMTYSFHVYSSDPQRRTIIINNRRLREGEPVTEDLLLEEITPDGVVLAVAGYRVHIAVLGEW